MTAGQSINYDAHTQDALRGVVRTVLTQVARDGLPGDHHFYIAFDTQAPSVLLSRRLKEKYPDEMMIVLQHRFWDLLVSEDRFEVKLTFDGIPERLVVPFAAVRVFYDPSVRFTLQFGEPPAQDEPRDAGSGRRKREGGGLELASRTGLRGIGDKPRLRPRSKSRSDDAEADAGQPEVARSKDNAPAMFVPRAVDGAPRPQPPPSVTTVAPAADTSDEAAKEPAAPANGAKVFSLDQFRNKK